MVLSTMYTAVLERTREIGVLKALGASPGYILNILLRETAVLAIAGSILGILLSYVTRFLIQNLVHSALIQAIVPRWWLPAAGIALRRRFVRRVGSRIEGSAAGCHRGLSI